MSSSKPVPCKMEGVGALAALRDIRARTPKDYYSATYLRRSLPIAVR